MSEQDQIAEYDDSEYQLHISKLGALILEVLNNYEKQHDIPFYLRLDLFQQLRDTCVVVIAEQDMQDEAAEAVKQ